jgi:hypothetical protein
MMFYETAYRTKSFARQKQACILFRSASFIWKVLGVVNTKGNICNKLSSRPLKYSGSQRKRLEKKLYRMIQRYGPLLTEVAWEIIWTRICI